MYSLPFVKTYLFDLDNTLYDESLFVQRGTKAVLEWLALRYGFKLPSLLKMMNSITATFLRDEWYQKLTEKVGIPHSQKLIDEMVEIYRHHLPHIRLFPDAARFLTKIRRRKGVILGIITDGMVSVQKLKVSSLGIQKMMDLQIFTWSKGIEYQKPHSWSFEYVEKKTGSSGTECCYFGDDPRKDFLAPNRLGWNTVCVRRHKSEEVSIPTQEHAAHIEIHSFDQISLD
jgi:putative hydrolase of the HAD superfamily